MVITTISLTGSEGILERPACETDTDYVGDDSESAKNGFPHPSAVVLVHSSSIERHAESKLTTR